MRSTAPFAVSAAPAEAGHDMNAGAADTVTAYTEWVDHFALGVTRARCLCSVSVGLGIAKMKESPL